jgi:tRNA-splicing ligase RtcB
MAKLQLTGKELRAIGYPEGPVISVAMNVMPKLYKQRKKEEALDALKNILAAPAMFIEDENLSPIAKLLLPKKKRKAMK